MAEARGDDPWYMPVSRVVDGWTLRCGCLYLVVMCDDGVTRTVIRRTEQNFPAYPHEEYHAIGGVG